MEDKVFSVLHGFVDQRGSTTSEIDWEPIPGGGNNRLFKLKINKTSFILKQYFTSETEEWDRVRNESAFLKYAQRCGTDAAPKLLFVDAANNAAVHEYVEGRKIEQKDLNKDCIEQAIAFIEDINQEQFRESDEAQKLIEASDACLNMAIHVGSVRNRLDRLRALKPDDSLDEAAHWFVSQTLYPIFKDSLERIEIAGNEPVMERSRQIISPSDFGFHNAVLRDDGRICFIDFEYAGWDDPVKMICDFFCQPEIRVKETHLKKFVNRVSKIVCEDSLQSNVEKLLPLYIIKWCCIILNVFDPLIKNRKGFASFEVDHRKQQLNKAEDYFKEHYHGLY